MCNDHDMTTTAIDNTVICHYRPRADAVDDLLDLIREHHKVIEDLELATDQPEVLYIGEDQDGSGPLILSIFQWVDAEAPRRAHSHPQIAGVWERMEAVCETRDKGPSLDFPHFHTVETL